MNIKKMDSLDKKTAEKINHKAYMWLEGKVKKDKSFIEIYKAAHTRPSEPWFVRLDYSDIVSVLKMGKRYFTKNVVFEGKDRASIAAKSIPKIYNLKKAKGFVLSLEGHNLSIRDVQEIADSAFKSMGKNSRFMWGCAESKKKNILYISGVSVFR